MTGVPFWTWILPVSGQVVARFYETELAMSASVESYVPFMSLPKTSVASPFDVRSFSSQVSPSHESARQPLSS